ncbi:MAG: uroporphyrinogen-III C-methyltransferase [Ferrovibrio sp.]|jgi:uroporphyrin-III C-methyltransferase|uniref:uroporphyrinogen-III C-methyltransferase n=1 Tax=Ferrovibrio sp. TaxID=1917215 RepID=UPI00391BC853
MGGEVYTGALPVYLAAMQIPALQMPVFPSGWVWLAGAGPGDPGLLTLHAVNALNQADVVIYDALVGEAILACARPGTLLEYAGKRGGKPSPKQRDISLRLVELARQGKRVLRLKGGDPFVFGRGAEEALSLREAGIPFRVIPGISAGVGGLAYAGIPLTHRDTNSCVTFLTGHNASGEVPDSVDWAAMVRASPVLVIYMAIKHLDILVSKLRHAGLAGERPAALVSHATLPQMRVLRSRLDAIVAAAAAAKIEPPALLVVGEVVDLHALFGTSDLQARLAPPCPIAI